MHTVKIAVKYALGAFYVNRGVGHIVPRKRQTQINKRAANRALVRALRHFCKLINFGYNLFLNAIGGIKLFYRLIVVFYLVGLGIAIKLIAYNLHLLAQIVFLLALIKTVTCFFTNSVVNLGNLALFGKQFKQNLSACGRI